MIGLVSGFSLAGHSDSESFVVAHALLSQDGFQRVLMERNKPQTSDETFQGSDF